MNNYTIIIILSIVFLISCNNEQNEKQIDKTLLVENINKQDFIEKTKDLKYYSFAINKFNHYRSLVFVGTDNSPSFDIESGKYDKELLRLISNIINLYPDSKTANELKKYKDLLGSHNYKRTSKVDSFIAQKISIK
ncbi:MAG: hypothetical protein B6I18_03910 [Bacteroidetes bacterium 4572_112]|nr:MAG: hypothetical protein B6I18_03910 [Bacteroidetes bacterium 4572_112]